MKHGKTEKISDLLPGILSSNGLGRHLNEIRLLECWSVVLGKQVTQYTTHLEIKERVLYAKISSSALRHELFLNRRKLIENLNKEVGTTVITDIRLS